MQHNQIYCHCYNWTQCIDGFSLLLKDMLGKVAMQRVQQFLAFSLLLKEPTEMQPMRRC